MRSSEEKREYARQWRLRRKDKIRDYLAANREKLNAKQLARARKRRTDNPGYERHSYLARRSKKLAAVRQYGLRNRHRRVEVNARRVAAKLRRSVSWADHSAIAAMYAEAAAITARTGVQHHVDHVIPLQGVNVSGLHVHNNLQILPALENIRKGNRFSLQEI